MGDRRDPRQFGRAWRVGWLAALGALVVACSEPSSIRYLAPQYEACPDLDACALSAPVVVDTVDGRARFRDRFGRRVLLRGVNVSQSWKPLETPFGDHTEADFHALSAMGFNVIRMVTTWGHIMPHEDELDRDYLEGLRTRVEWAERAGLFVILDMHQDLYGYGFTVAVEDGQRVSIGNGAPEWSCPEENYAELSDPVEPWHLNHLNPGIIACYDYFWDHPNRQRQFAAAFEAAVRAVADSQALIGVDLLNEPSWGSLPRLSTYEQELLTPLYAMMMRRARRVRPDLIHFMEPGAVKNVTGETSLELPSYAGHAYTPHLYDSTIELGMPYDPASTFFADRLVADQETATRLSGPLFIGEWGVPNALENKSVFVRDLTGHLDAHDVGWTYWESGPSNDNTGFFPAYGIIDRTGDADPPWIRELARPYPAAWPDGDVEFAFDPETGELNLASETRLVSSAPVGEIVLPAWAESYEVLEQAGIEESTRRGGRLWVRLASGPVSLRLRLGESPP